MSDQEKPDTAPTLRTKVLNAAVQKYEGMRKAYYTWATKESNQDEATPSATKQAFRSVAVILRTRRLGGPDTVTFRD